AFNEFKAIAGATRHPGDIFKVTVDGQAIEGDVYLREVDPRSGGAQILEVHSRQGNTGAFERWEILSTDGVDNRMLYTRVPDDGSPGTAQLFKGDFHPPANTVPTFIPTL
ncbi:MAG: hypothetical protein ACYCW6_10210, partial [Candidatus Xenobia bacterium]